MTTKNSVLLPLSLWAAVQGCGGDGARVPRLDPNLEHGTTCILNATCDAGSPDLDGGVFNPKPGKPGPCAGDRNVATTADLADIANCSSISGVLTLAPQNVGSVTLPVLETVGGLTVRYAASTFGSLSLPKLTVIAGALLLRDTRLASLSMPALAAIEKDAAISNTLLPSLSLPALTKVSGQLDVDDNPSLNTLSLPALSAAGALFVDRVPALASLDISALTTVGIFELRRHQVKDLSFPVLAAGGDLLFFDSPSLQTLDLPALARATSFTVEACPLVTSVNVPQLAEVTGVGPFSINSSEALTSLDFPALKTVVGEFSIYCNPALATLNLPIFAKAGNGVSIGRGGCDGQAATSALTILDLPSLATVAQDLWIAGHPLLSSLSFPVLKAVTHDVTIKDNPALSTLTFPVLADAASLAIAGNGMLAAGVARGAAPLLPSSKVSVTGSP